MPSWNSHLLLDIAFGQRVVLAIGLVFVKNLAHFSVYTYDGRHDSTILLDNYSYGIDLIKKKYR